MAWKIKPPSNFGLLIFQRVTNRYIDYAVLTTTFLSEGKAIPLQTWTDPEGSRRMRLSVFKTICT
jgi:hypothetical protein